MEDKEDKKEEQEQTADEMVLAIKQEYDKKIKEMQEDFDKRMKEQEAKHVKVVRAIMTGQKVEEKEEIEEKTFGEQLEENLNIRFKIIKEGEKK